MPTAIPAPGTAHPAVPGSRLDPLVAPAVALPHHLTWEHFNDLVDGIVFYGILAFGLTFPLVGALHAFVFN